MSHSPIHAIHNFLRLVSGQRLAEVTDKMDQLAEHVSGLIGSEADASAIAARKKRRRRGTRT